MEKKYTSIGQILLDYRKINNVSQLDLASQFEVDVRTIIRWEKNETLLNPNMEEEMVDITFIPYQVIRNLNAPVSIPTIYNFNLRKYSLSSVFNEMPNPNWIKDKMIHSTNRLRTIQHDSDIDNIIRCSLYQKHISKPIRKSLILKAIELLPELNFIIFDNSGYYSGHSVYFPISLKCYQKIKDRTLKEEELTEHDFINHENEEQPVFYAYDMNADCIENTYYLFGKILRFFKEIPNKNYLYASYTSRYDTYKVNEQVGTTLVWEDKEIQKQIKSIAPPRLYEGNFTEFLK